jgi:hypothetical protein
MTIVQTPTSAAQRLLEGYASEEEMAEARSLTKRTLRAERQRGDGPPWVRISRQIYYPEEGWRSYLKMKEQRALRVRKIG